MYKYIHVLQAQKLKQLILLMNRSILFSFQMTNQREVWMFSSKCIKEFRAYSIKLISNRKEQRTVDFALHLLGEREEPINMYALDDG